MTTFYWASAWSQLSWAAQMFDSDPPAGEELRPMAERMLTEHYGVPLPEALAMWRQEESARRQRRAERERVVPSLISVTSAHPGVVVRFSFYESRPMSAGDAQMDVGLLTRIVVNMDAPTPREALMVAIPEFLRDPERKGSYSPDGRVWV